MRSIPIKFAAKLALLVAALYGLAWGIFRDEPKPYVEWEIPQHPVMKAAYDYAQSIELPPSMPKQVDFNFCSLRILGLCFGKATSDEYFRHLCKSEAGEFKFEEVSEAEGFYLITPRFEAHWSDEIRDRYRLEDPVTGSADRSFVLLSEFSTAMYFVQPPLGRFQFIDRHVFKEKIVLERQYRSADADPEGRKTIRMAVGDFKDHKWVVKSKGIVASDARYGVAFRGIRRLRDREHGIAGSEIFIIDRQNKKVLAAKREFVKSAWVPSSLSGVSWETARTCSGNFYDTPLYQFVYRVLKPKKVDE